MFTYIVATENNKFVKIGKTVNIHTRMRSLKTSNPHPIYLVGYFEGNIERELHTKYALYRKHLEWFGGNIISKVKKEPGFIIPDSFDRNIKPEREFAKLYVGGENKRLIMSLSETAFAMLTFIIHNIEKNKDVIEITPKKFLKQAQLKSLRSYYNAIDECTEKNIISKINNSYYLFFINPAILFYGDREKKYKLNLLE